MRINPCFTVIFIMLSCVVWPVQAADNSGTISNIKMADIIYGSSISKPNTKISNCLGTSSSDLTTPKVLNSIAELKFQENGTFVRFSGVVIAVGILQGVYVETPERNAGTHVRYIEYPQEPQVGQSITVEGIVHRDSIYQTVNCTSWSLDSDEIRPLKPLFISCKALGGAACGYQPGVKDGIGLNNTGLLVRISGRITYEWDPVPEPLPNERPWFTYVDDGSHLDDGNEILSWGSTSGCLGVMVLHPQDIYIPGCSNITVTGISGYFEVNGKLVRCVMVRTQDDIVPIETQ